MIFAFLWRCSTQNYSHHSLLIGRSFLVPVPFNIHPLTMSQKIPLKIWVIKSYELWIYPIYLIYSTSWCVTRQLSYTCLSIYPNYWNASLEYLKYILLLNYKWPRGHFRFAYFFVTISAATAYRKRCIVHISTSRTKSVKKTGWPKNQNIWKRILTLSVMIFVIANQFPAFQNSKCPIIFICISIFI